MQLRDAVEITNRNDPRLHLYEDFLRQLLSHHGRNICRFCPAEQTCEQIKDFPNFTRCCVEFQRWRLQDKQQHILTFGRTRRSNIQTDTLDRFFGV